MPEIELLCEIIGQGGQASADSFRMKVGYEALVREGYVRETGVVQAITCEECDDPHDAEIVFEGGQYGFFCPKRGFTPVNRSAVTGLLPDFPKLVASLAEIFECTRRKTSPLQGMTWRIGAVESAVGDVAIYFHPVLKGEQDAHALESNLSREIRSPFRLILIGEGQLPFPEAKTIRLNDAIAWEPASGSFTMTVDPRVIVGATMKRTGGAPNKYGKTLAAVIQNRMTNGTALPGRNEEAKAILEVYCIRNPKEKPPSLPTIKRYLTAIRSGL